MYALSWAALFVFPMLETLLSACIAAAGLPSFCRQVAKTCCRPPAKLLAESNLQLTNVELSVTEADEPVEGERTPLSPKKRTTGTPASAAPGASATTANGQC